MQICELIFVVVYTIELVLKMIVHKGYFFCNEDASWNIFDLILVALGLYDTAMLLMYGGDGGGFNASFMRSLRIMKLGKVLRVFRLMRMFRELRLILNSLIGSMASLFWSLVMMLMIFFMFGLCFVQGVTGYLLAEGAGDEELVYYFGSVQTAVWTLFAVVTGGLEWADFFDPLVRVGRLYSSLFLFFVAFAHVALMNILTALFVEHAIDIAKPDREALVFDLRRAMLERDEELGELFQMVDKDGSGTLSLKEFSEQMRNSDGALRTFLEAEGLDIRDADLFFRMLSAHTADGTVSIKAFIDGCNKLTGGPTSLDMQAIMWQMQVMQRHSEDHAEGTRQRLNTIEEAMQFLATGRCRSRNAPVEQFHV
jgi:hypothetical protein